MNAVFLAYLLVFGLSAAACLVSVPRARRIRHPGTRRGMVVFLGSVALWSLGYLGYLVVPMRPAKVLFYTLGFVFAFLAVGAWLYFAAAYTGRPTWETPYWNLGFAAFLVAVALKLTNPLHHLYFTTEWVTEPFPHLAVQHQLLYWVTLGLSYAVIAIAFFMLFERFYLTGSNTRPLEILVALTGIPAALTIFGEQIAGVLPLMYEPPGVALFAVGTLFFYDQRFEAIRLTGESEKPAIFLDKDDRIRDYNQAAREVFPQLHGAIGDQISSVSTVLAGAIDDEGVFSVSVDGESRCFEVSWAPFSAAEVRTGELVTFTDVTERETYRRRLEAKTDQLEALNHMVRHDIRNDMSVVLGWAESLRDAVDEDAEDALERVVLKSQHVVGITENARDFIASMAGDGTVELKSVDLAPVLEDELATVRDSYPDAAVSLSGEVPSVSVRANEMLSSVFRNLLENAISHNDAETPEVDVSCEEDGDRVRVRIADDGPGVPDDQKDEIFGKGERGGASPGTGIGLFLVGTLTEQFGGEVWVEDNQPEGSVFVVELVKSD